MTSVPPRILLVEDNSADIDLLTIAFEEAGVVVLIDSVCDGREAKERLHHETMPDLRLIVLDINLPSISGLDLLDLIKLDPKWESVPTVMLTSSERKQDRDRATARNVDAYLVKPQNFHGYVRIVTELIACIEKGPRPASVV